ncbi:hypothetical protein, partial [Mesorhizobium sp. M7A.F.Ca.CA.004.07.1.1]|uniref:hypothetical protein n=1 Tax=Mesorhizobium sp. M7A.F.Ca.CA.004.07.1.1 TaxID=2496688 RepID=UPI0019D2FE26
ILQARPVMNTRHAKRAVAGNQPTDDEGTVERRLHQTCKELQCFTGQTFALRHWALVGFLPSEMKKPAGREASGLA